jgi:hypothetical protein
MPVSRRTKLLNIKKAEAPLRAYAYLTASMGARTGVSDVLDCLVPFVVAGVAEQDGDARLGPSSVIPSLFWPAHSCICAQTA